ncbi:protein farnesyltransferase subunit beta [[Candida] jaroonii]|uniref:Protein farnesyltransferase subunit beta n=1 Tax=[Candida] jaroonii TaxID=467808 RepID=A0ACA9YEL9_9ASCO|nr:protein farnesyltransferase subunit beta [[Candida] jaroonii]
MEDQIKYLINIIKGNDFHDVKPPNIYNNLKKMLGKPLVANVDYDSETLEKQSEVESMVNGIYQDILDSHRHINNHFEIEKHGEFVNRSLTIPLPGYYKGYDANHSWMLYWLTNANCLLGQQENELEMKDLIVEKIKTLIVDNGKGGISGGANQLGHLASSYAAILTLVLVEEFDLLKSISSNLYQWMMSLKQDDGSFIMHYNGEADTRSMYCALVIGSLLNLLNDDFTHGCLSWVQKCQTYEGGFAGVPGTEAHGGYTFCGVACFFLLNKSLDNLNIDKLIRWSVARQYQLEGGLSGRANKLVDACYGFWIGGVYAMIETFIKAPIFDRDSLKIYLLNCAQDSVKGGFKDKPNTRVDFYHTNYSLLGLSCSEYNFESGDLLAYDFKTNEINDDTNVSPINPVFGLPHGKAEACRKYFNN